MSRTERWDVPDEESPIDVVRRHAEEMDANVLCRDCGAILEPGGEFVAFDGAKPDGSPIFDIVCAGCKRERMNG